MVVVDPEPATVVATVPLDGPSDVRLTPDGRRAYVNAVGGTFAIDTATNTVVATFPPPDRRSAVALQISHDGRTAYAAFAGDADATSAVVERIDTATNTAQIATIPGRCPGCGLALGADDRSLYVLSSALGTSDDPSSRLTTLDSTTLQVAGYFAFDEYAVGDDLAVVGGPGAQRAYFVLDDGLRSLAV